MIDSLFGKFEYRFSNDYTTFIKGKRTIASPSNTLKGYQFEIKKHLEEEYTFPRFVTGYKKKTTIADNAQIHISKKYILNIDIKNFFSSINRKHLKDEFSGKVKNIELFIDYVTFNGTLPLGSPTSPIISNIIFLKIDYLLVKLLLLRGYNVSYSRYADDISVGFNSYEERYNIFNLLENIINQYGFVLNSKKTKLFCFNKKRVVTGMILSDEKVGIGYKKYREVKKILYFYFKFDIGYFPYIKGLVLFLKSVDFYRYDKLRRYYFNAFAEKPSFQRVFMVDINGEKIKTFKFQEEFNYTRPFKYNYKKLIRESLKYYNEGISNVKALEMNSGY